MISVIITTHNGRKEMCRRAIQSVIDQTFSDWELIVSDDASEDGTDEMVASFSDDRIKYIRQQENFGNHSRPKNAGIIASTGELVAFLDSDNAFRPDHLQALLSAIERTGADLAYGDRWITDDRGKEVAHHAGGQDFDPFLLLQQNYIDTSDVLIRREALEYVGGFDERYKKYLDWNLFVRLAKAGYKFVRVPNILTDYHIHDDMMSFKTLDAKGRMMPAWSPHDVEIRLPFLGVEPPEPRVAIFTLTYDRLDYTQKCFESMYKTAGYEIDHFVVDNGSHDGTQEWLKVNKNIKKVILNPDNKGISIASNQALDEIAKGDYDIVMKVDNDCLFLTHDWLKTMIKLWKANHMMALSLYVQGLRDNPGGAPRLGQGMLSGELVGITKHIGGICCFTDARAYTNFRWDESSTLHGMQDLEFSRFLLHNGYGMAYLENHFCEHYEGTEGQEKRYKQYFQRRKKEKVTRYKRDYTQIQERESAFSRGTPWGERVVDTVKRYAKHIEGSVLDVGCGDGIALDVLTQLGHPCEGIDLSKVKVELAKKHGHKAVVGRMENLPYADKAFDTVLCSHTLEHAKDLKQAVKELQRVGKRLVLVLPIEEKTTNPAQTTTFSDPKQIIDLFDGEVVHSESLNRLEPEFVLIMNLT